MAFPRKPAGAPPPAAPTGNRSTDTAKAFMAAPPAPPPSETGLALQDALSLLRGAERKVFEDARAFVLGRDVPTRDASGTVAAFLTEAKVHQTLMATMRANLQKTATMVGIELERMEVASIRDTMASNPDLNKTEAKSERYNIQPRYREMYSNYEDLKVLVELAGDLHWVLTRLVATFGN